MFTFLRESRLRNWLLESKLDGWEIQSRKGYVVRKHRSKVRREGKPR